jgi:hypothetical protein
MKFQLLHRAVKGTPIVSLNTVTRTGLLARQIHNARILPTAAATRPARLRRSLPAAAVLFSSPTLPAWRRWRGRGYWCSDVRPANLKTVDVDPSTSPRPRRQASRLRPRADVDPAPPTITRTTTSFATEVSPASTPNTLSHRPPKSAIYSCQCGLIRETCLDSSSLIDWLWVWWMDLVAPSLFE